jgi:hypothetical protein
MSKRLLFYSAGRVITLSISKRKTSDDMMINLNSSVVSTFKYVTPLHSCSKSKGNKEPHSADI